MKKLGAVRKPCQTVQKSLDNRRAMAGCPERGAASTVKQSRIGFLLASLVLATGCRAPGGAMLELPDPCEVDQTLYADATDRDNWVIDDPSPVMRSAFPDPTIAEPLHRERISDMEDLHAANASIFTLQAGFESAYECLRVVSVAAIPADGLQRSQIRVDFLYHGRLRQAYAYGTKPTACLPGSRGALVIPGSGLNQSSAIVARDPSNYHAGILDALDGVEWRYVLIKPNEDTLAWHDGRQRKAGGDLVWNWHLNRNGSYSVAYLVQGLAVQKWMDDCFSYRVLAGLSQGGAAALLIGLQSRPSDVVVSSGHSLLFNQTEWAGHNQLIGVPGLAKLSRAAPLVGALERSSSRWLFTYGMKESDIYKIEAETGLTASYVGRLPNVEVTIHSGTHSFPVPEVRAFLARNSSKRQP